MATRREVSRPNAAGGQPRKAPAGSVKGPLLDEIRFPVQFSSEQQDDLGDYEFSVEVTDPDGFVEADSSWVRLRGDTLRVCYQPETVGRYIVRVLADGAEVCASQYFTINEDGSCSARGNVAGRKQRPPSAGSTRSGGSTGRESSEDDGHYTRLQRRDSGLSRNSSRLSTTSSLDRLAAAPTRYSLPSSPGSEQPRSRSGSVSSQSNSATGEYAVLGDRPPEASYSTASDSAQGDMEGDQLSDEEEDDQYEEGEARYEVLRHQPLRKYQPSVPPAHHQGVAAVAAATQQRRSRRAMSESSLPNRQSQRSAQSQKRRQPESRLEVFTSTSGHSFIIVDGATMQLQTLGQASGGAVIARTADGSVWHVQNGMATPYKGSGTSVRVKQTVNITTTMGDSAGKLQRYCHLMSNNRWCANQGVQFGCLG